MGAFKLSKTEKKAVQSIFVYVVDDEPTVASLLDLILSEAGIRAKIFTTPQSALDSFLAEPIKPAVLLTDYDMGKMTGADLIYHCLKVCPTLKTMMVSGSITSETLLRSGIKIDRFLPKPFHPIELVGNVVSLITNQPYHHPAMIQMPVSSVSRPDL